MRTSAIASNRTLVVRLALQASRGQIGRASRIGGTTATRAAKTTDFAAGIRPLGAERVVIKGLR